MADDLVRYTVQVVAAYLGKNPVATSGLADLINTTYQSLASAGDGGEEPASAQVPAVSIRRSVKPDAITCLDCGKQMKMLKRHLRTEHGLSVADYRAKWSLPADYPMVAPEYAQRRSEFAKTIGLGKKIAERRGPKAQ